MLTDRFLAELIIDGEWIETTPEHPFYVEGQGWTEAGDLRMGDRVRKADGSTGTVWLKWEVHKTQEMYNLTVDTAHTFYVGEGQWLVHNACNFGKQGDLRKALGITDPKLDAHHLIPWQFRNEPLVQKAAEAGWHMNHAYNGIPMLKPHTKTGHPVYNKTVKKMMDNKYYPGMSPDDAYDALLLITDQMRTKIKNKLILLK